jgi:H+/Cl- antiporter ClcA
VHPLLVASMLSVPVGIACGLAGAGFLAGLDWVTELRTMNPWLIYALPGAGWLAGVLLDGPAGALVGGTRQVVERLSNSKRLAARMGPLVILGTWVTHLFGGSAGREGTAVQLGASLADTASQLLRLSDEAGRHLVLAGVAGGFAGVFGTPWAGIIFSLELGGGVRARAEAWFPLLVSAWAANWAARAVGTTHAQYPTLNAPALDSALLAQLGALTFGVALLTALCVGLLHWFKNELKRRVPTARRRLALGGLAVVAMYGLTGRSDVLGLGVPTILDAFAQPAEPLTWALKMLVTLVTVGSGFIGGEVTPLFFIGATFGSALGPRLGLPLELSAGLGLVALFGAASGAPLALVVMGGELFGWEFVAPALPVVVGASALSRRWRLYTR